VQETKKDDEGVPFYILLAVGMHQGGWNLVRKEAATVCAGVAASSSARLGTRSPGASRAGGERRRRVLRGCHLLHRRAEAAMAEDVHEPSRGSAGCGGAVRAAAARRASEGSARMRQAHGSRAGPRDRVCGTLTRRAAAAAMARTPSDGAVHPGRVRPGLLSRQRQAVAGRVGPKLS
jgi:hypothetical protein